MSKKITVDPNLFNLSGPKTSRKTKKKYSGGKSDGKPHDMNYNKLLKKLKEMKQHKLNETKKRKKKVETNVNINAPAISSTKKPLEQEQPISGGGANSTIVSTNSESMHQVDPPTPRTFSPTINMTKPLVLQAQPFMSASPPPVSPSPAPAPALAPPLVPMPNKPIVLLPEPQYGILKNGTLPTLRGAGKTKKATRFEKLRTIKRKYKLGKDGRKIAVLLKDNKTRKKVKSEIQDLKQKSIKEVRQYLQERNIIKAGSIAPNNVLRKMYEDMYLAGGVENKNQENLIHNFINDEDE